MRKLVLHSDQIKGKTQMDEAFLNFFNSKPKIAYIPSQSDLDRNYFNKKVEWYKQFGINDLFYFDLDKEFNEDKIKELLSCDAIHLSGGNTYYFLNSIKKRGFISLLRDYVEKGGVLIGISAGSVIMSETIDIVTLHDEENIVDLKDLIEYSKSNNSIIYACSDGDGIIVNDDGISFFGNVLKIRNGEVLR